MNLEHYLAVVAALVRQHGFTTKAQSTPNSPSTATQATQHLKFPRKYPLVIEPQDRTCAKDAIDLFSWNLPTSKASSPFFKALNALAHRQTLLDKHTETAAHIIPTFLNFPQAKKRPTDLEIPDCT